MKRVHSENVSVDDDDGFEMGEEVETQPPAKKHRRSRAERLEQVGGLSQRELNTQQEGGPSLPLPRCPATAGAAPTQNGVGPSTQGTNARFTQPLRPGGRVALREEGLAGHLKKIQLINFMCHHNFEMEFGPHITLVSGTNGSGKSAVMQALQVCLGVAARTTGRGHNLSSFIRSGQSEARVMVTICNKGPDAFEHDRFGDYINVERRIGTTSNYILKNAAGGSLLHLIAALHA
ncbi:hypothetical protein DUNSADRAFT_14673 [Dunaliella salina]|uniref:Rad50/SbcC-type AAA domain-containing protein n=1 Tax=Dunaliella salina TaxID=3046 RepID=A0ABQ7G6Y5_DUNSA|nr:hypothetical protein DUNSADRAFT_14673 [Dunaliella salina]|eukprot:KAF5830376.1 hypothetical protein DUNSADRAFT_14673 [Dunaliella salina]